MSCKVNGKLSTVVVECIGNGGFAFINITSLQINDISFYRFGHVLPTFVKQLILAHLTVAECSGGFRNVEREAQSENFWIATPTSGHVGSPN